MDFIECKFLQYPQHIDESTRELIEKMVQQEPGKRLSWQELFDNPLIGVLKPPVKVDPVPSLDHQNIKANDVEAFKKILSDNVKKFNEWKEKYKAKNQKILEKHLTEIELLRSEKEKWVKKVEELEQALAKKKH
eukprot:TRINITY_DN1889_c0_g1_i6.p1 TRINITY_DN1889_c0_g1~~TRINITY_DN1889_c0_g1_i6.p1  ORF type:complete len:134 (+),score=32.12 TRINITY_DN1889_c0_g1_i6:1038-1439(+)